MTDVLDEMQETHEMAEMPETLDPPERPAPADDLDAVPVAAFAQALVEHAQAAADVEATEKRLSGIDPAPRAAPSPARDRELPFGESRFNADQAVKVIADKTREIEALKADWDEQKSLAADAKKAYDQGVESLLKIIDRFREQQLQQIHQPTLREVEEGEAPAPARASCPWERAHPGERCPICSHAAAAAADGVGDGPSPDTPDHPQHAAHLEAADQANQQQLLELVERLGQKRLHVIAPDLLSLSPEDLRTLREYSVAESCPVPPALLAQACIAGAVDADEAAVQQCTRCGARLGWHRGDAVVRPYPEGDLVGLSCAEASEAYVPADDPRDETPVEEAAPAPWRKRKKGNKR